MHKFFTVFALIIMLLTTGCAGFGIVATSDPAVKLSDAQVLYTKQGRPIPAERLIREAIDIYQEENNQLGLAYAYWTYGFFFVSWPVEKFSANYIKHGFMDKSVTYDTRYQASIDYFKKARAIYEKNKQFDRVTNIDLNMGLIYMKMGEHTAGCHAFDESLKSYRENKRLKPNADTIVPKGYTSYEDYLSVEKRHYKC